MSSDTPHKTDIVVQRAATNPDATAAAGPIGRWLAEDIRGGGVIDRVQMVLEIAADGAISGSGGCNAMRGTAIIAGDAIAFGAIASTRMWLVRVPSWSRKASSSRRSGAREPGASIRPGASLRSWMRTANRS